MPRPAFRFRGFIGQKTAVDRLSRQLDGAMARNEPFPTTLLHGPPGVGKTLLARTLAEEYGTSLIRGMGYDDRATLTRKFSTLKVNDFFLIDECHRLDPKEQELLYEAMGGSIPEVGRKASGRVEQGEGRVKLPPWCLILATDQPGLLLNALLNRVDLKVGLDYYPRRELKEVVEVLATEANLLLKPQASGLIAQAACGLPRNARQLLHNLRRHYPEAGNQQLGKKHVREFLHFMGIDETGLGPDEFRYLKALGDQGSASLETLASMLSTDTLHLRRQIEAVLVRRGLVKIAPGGRQLTATGRKLIEEHRKNNPGPSPEKDEDDDDD